MKTRKELLKEVLAYVFWGVMTTLVNLGLFFLLDTVLSIPYLVANAVAIVGSILFAYVVNKLFVFESKTASWQENIREFLSFIGFRLLSGLVDMLIMWLLVDFLTLDTNLAKLATQFIIVVLNYIFSKFFIFKD